MQSWKMFIITFAFALIALRCIIAEKPSYIQICSEKDPKLNQCLVNNIYNLIRKVCDGVPELNLPSNNPLVIEKIAISDTSTSKIVIKDSKLSGICNCVVKSFQPDFDKFHFDTEVSFEWLELNGTYDIDIRLLSAVPIAHKGSVYFTANNVGAKGSVDLKVVTKDDKRYVYISKMNLNIDIKKFDIDFGSNAEANQMNEIINTFIGKNQEEIIKVFKPTVEEIFIKYIISVVNTILKQYTYEELFPDRV